MGQQRSQDYQSDLDDAMIVDGGAGNGALQSLHKASMETLHRRVRSDIDNLDPYGYFEVRAKLPSEAGAANNLVIRRWWPSDLAE